VARRVWPGFSLSNLNLNTTIHLMAHPYKNTFENTNNTRAKRNNCTANLERQSFAEMVCQSFHGVSAVAELKLGRVGSRGDGRRTGFHGVSAVAALPLGEEANAGADQATASTSSAPVPASTRCSFSGR
jgi:hypothetical protein